MIVQHQLPTKAYYLDRLGNMSTSSSIISSPSSIASSSPPPPSGVVIGAGIPGGLRNKQVLSLRPKQPNCYVQHLDHKAKDPVSSSMMLTASGGPAPVTMLALKKKDKSEKNVVTQLTYRKPSSLLSTSSSTSSGDTHLVTLLENQSHQQHINRRPGSPNSSGYDTDSLLDQENCDVFSSLLNFGYNSHHHNNGLMHHHHHDMLHSHPIWSPQPSTHHPSTSSTSSTSTSSSNGHMMSNYFMETEKNNNNKFLVQ